MTEDVKELKKDVKELRQEMDQQIAALRKEEATWRDKWAARQWALMGVVIVFALGAVGNLLVLLSQRGSP